jgi:hypothetical protein
LVSGLVENVVENVLIQVLADPQEEEATIVQQVQAIAAHGLGAQRQGRRRVHTILVGYYACLREGHIASDDMIICILCVIDAQAMFVSVYILG